MTRSRVIDLGLGLLAIAQLAAAAWLVPTSTGGVAQADGTPLGALCWVHAVFDIDCPMCGMTRSFVALAHGRLGDALSFHPAGPLLFAAMIALVIAVGVVAVRRARPLVERSRFVFTFQSVAIACVAIGVVRMMRS